MKTNSLNCIDMKPSDRDTIIFCLDCLLTHNSDQSKDLIASEFVKLNSIISTQKYDYDTTLCEILNELEYKNCLIINEMLRSDSDLNAQRINSVLDAMSFATESLTYQSTMFLLIIIKELCSFHFNSLKMSTYDYIFREINLQIENEYKIVASKNMKNAYFDALSSNVINLSEYNAFKNFYDAYAPMNHFSKTDFDNFQKIILERVCTDRVIHTCEKTDESVFHQLPNDVRDESLANDAIKYASYSHVHELSNQTIEHKSTSVPISYEFTIPETSVYHLLSVEMLSRLEKNLMKGFIETDNR